VGPDWAVHIRGWIRPLPGPVAGIRCEVPAPSKLQRPAGDQVKTDAKDAVHLARLLRLDEITAVAVPSVEQRPPATWSVPVRTAAAI
jgi:transposase